MEKNLMKSMEQMMSTMFGQFKEMRMAMFSCQKRNKPEVVAGFKDTFKPEVVFQITGYDVISAMHPADRIRGGALVIVRSGIKYEELEFQISAVSKGA
ncbi:GM11693 [Drosophila sechellia]|uniref:GM11693 n=1 Tax=Drosophila sechellia TaxID=7238 RepID=B4IL07_DROSE|nr:GM11693 [Drosophila sechellia]